MIKMLKVKEFTEQVIKEGKKITWPSRKEATMSMLMVVVVVIIASLFFLLMDFSSLKIVHLLLNFGVDSSDL